MANYNKITIIGRLTADPVSEVKNIGNVEKEFCKFQVAVDRRFQKDKTNFFSCSAWGNTAKFAAQYFKKGLLVLVDGEMNINIKKEAEKNLFYPEIAVDTVQLLEKNKTVENRAEVES